jgi:protoporphyrinogen oxidase
MSDQASSSESPVVILGAGPAGLACALRILLSCDRKVVVIDRAPFVGGAGGSFAWKKHTLDYGPHAFHTRGGEPEEMVRDLFKDSPELLLEGRKHIHVHLKGRKFRYPLQVGEALLKFNFFLSIRIIFEFMITSLFHAAVSIPIENFENWGKKRFGAKLYKLGFGDYTEKVWKTKASQISVKFASEKIQGFSFINLIKRLFRIGGSMTEPYYQTWIYPRDGAGRLYERMADRVRDLGGEILLSTSVVSLEPDGHGIGSVGIEKEGTSRSIPCSALVSSIPLPGLVALMGSKAPFVARFSASKLNYISLIAVFLEIDLESAMDSHWIYLLDPGFRFNRVSEQKNLSTYTMEEGKTVLCLEWTCRIGDDSWQLTDDEIEAVAREDLSKVSFLKGVVPKITDCLVKRVPSVYEVYYDGFEGHADVALSYLREFDNVVSIGRRGLFLQGDQHQSMEMGLAVADMLATDSLDPASIASYYKRYVRYIDDPSP